MKKTVLFFGFVLIGSLQISCVLAGVKDQCVAQQSPKRQVEKKSPFLVQPPKNKKVSKNRLKENIGEELKDALHACAEVMNELGRVQQEVAALQRRLLSRVEKLVENSKPFKRATRADLSDALHIVSTVKNELHDQQVRVRGLGGQLNKNNCLKG